MLLKKLDPSDSNYLKGLAILAIVLHNYFHILANAPGENEFSFSIKNTYTFLHNISVTPQDIIKQLFSFFGHYGVQVFIFLSGYGLAMKCSTPEQLNYKNFIFLRLQKIYPVLFFSIVLLFAYKAAIKLLFSATEIDLISFLKDAFLKLTLVSNFIPGEALSISGPWWFFSLIIQLYLISPFLLKLKNYNYLLAIISISWIIQLLFIAFGVNQIEYLRYNFLGHLPEFCLGIYMARAGGKQINAGGMLLTFVLFVAGSFYPYAWVLSFLCVPILAVTVYSYAAPFMGNVLRKTFVFFGKNSLYFFAVHGLCRAPFVPLGNRSVTWSVLASVAFLLVASALSMLFKYIVNYTMLFVATSWRGSSVNKIDRSG